MLRACHTEPRVTRAISGAVRSAWTLGVCLFAVACGSVVGCGSVDDRPFAWGYLSPAIFQPTCATPSCHSQAVAVAGLDFSNPDRGYASLTSLNVWVANPQSSPDAGACQDVGGTTYCARDRPLVIPFDPPQSRLVNMLRARGAPRMPPDRPLTETDIKLVESWILDGARRHPGDAVDGGIGDGGIGDGGIGQ